MGVEDDRYVHGMASVTIGVCGGNLFPQDVDSTWAVRLATCLRAMWCRDYGSTPLAKAADPTADEGQCQIAGGSPLNGDLRPSYP